MTEQRVEAAGPATDAADTTDASDAADATDTAGGRGGRCFHPVGEIVGRQAAIRRRCGSPRRRIGQAAQVDRRSETCEVGRWPSGTLGCIFSRRFGLLASFVLCDCVCVCVFMLVCVFVICSSSCSLKYTSTR